MVAVSPFTPKVAGSKTITVAATTAAVQLAFPSVDQQVMVTSVAGNAVAFIEFGISTQTAVVLTSCPILPGTVNMFTIGPTVTHIATIGTAGNTLYVTCGDGV